MRRKAILEKLIKALGIPQARLLLGFRVCDSRRYGPGTVAETVALGGVPALQGTGTWCMPTQEQLPAVPTASLQLESHKGVNHRIHWEQGRAVWVVILRESWKVTLCTDNETALNRSIQWFGQWEAEAWMSMCDLWGQDM